MAALVSYINSKAHSNSIRIIRLDICVYNRLRIIAYIFQYLLNPIKYYIFGTTCIHDAFLHSACFCVEILVLLSFFFGKIATTSYVCLLHTTGLLIFPVSQLFRLQGIRRGHMAYA